MTAFQLLDLDRLLGLVAARLLLRRVLALAAVLVDHDAAQVVADLDEAGADRLAGRRVLVLGEIAADSTAVDAEAHAVVRRARLDGARELDFAGGRVDHADVDRDVGVFLLPADADAVEADAAAATGRVLFVRGDGPHDEVLRAGELADLRGRLRADAAGSAEVLLFEHRAELRALDHPELLGRRQLVRQHSGEIVPDAAIPPAGRRLVSELRHADRRLTRLVGRKHQGPRDHHKTNEHQADD